MRGFYAAAGGQRRRQRLGLWGVARQEVGLTQLVDDLFGGVFSIHHIHDSHQSDVSAMIKSVQGYMREQEIEEKHIDKLTEILISRTNFKPNVDYIYIHPQPQDYEFFFYDHFSLNPKVLSGIVRTGFKAAMNTLRAYNI